MTEKINNPKDKRYIYQCPNCFLLVDNVKNSKCIHCGPEEFNKKKTYGKRN